MSLERKTKAQLIELIKSKDAEIRDLQKRVATIRECNKALVEDKSELLDRIERLTMERNMVIAKSKKLEEDSISKTPVGSINIEEFYGEGLEFDKFELGSGPRLVPFHSYIELKAVDKVAGAKGYHTFRLLVLSASDMVKAVLVNDDTITKVFDIPLNLVYRVEHDSIGKMSLFVDKVLSIFNRNK